MRHCSCALQLRTARGSDLSKVRDAHCRLLEKSIVTVFWTFAGVLHSRTGIDTPAPHIGRTWLGTNGISCTAPLLHLARLVRLAGGLPHPTIYDTPFLDTQHLIDI